MVLQSGMKTKKEIIELLEEWVKLRQTSEEAAHTYYMQNFQPLIDEALKNNNSKFFSMIAELMLERHPKLAKWVIKGNLPSEYKD
jgi:hypothetical protein